MMLRPYDPDTEQRGESIQLDWEGLDTLEVH